MMFMIKPTSVKIPAKTILVDPANPQHPQHPRRMRCWDEAKPSKLSEEDRAPYSILSGSKRNAKKKIDIFMKADTDMQSHLHFLVHRPK